MLYVCLYHIEDGELKEDEKLSDDWEVKLWKSMDNLKATKIKVRDLTISVFPDHTARARATFNEARRQLRGIESTR